MGLLQQMIQQYTPQLIERLKKDVLPKVSGEELRRTQLVLSLM